MYTDHIVNAISNHQLVNDSTLHVIGVVSNPVRYHSRYRIFREWQAFMLAAANVKLYVVELAFGDRHHEVTSAQDPTHLQLRSSHELWHKENMINLGERRLLPRDWRYAAWIDGDVFFANPNWALETIHALQHHPVVQPWSDCIDLGPHGNALKLYPSFASLASRGVRQQTHPNQPYPYGHSGFAWACRREFWENTRGLIDWAILGSADHHMAWAMLNHIDWSVHRGMTDSFKRHAADWQRTAYQLTHGHLGYVPGRIEHRFHGPKKRRYYRERWQILVDNKFDPDTDLRRDGRGLLYVYGKPQLEEDIRNYMRARHEDSIEQE